MLVTCPVKMTWNFRFDCGMRTVLVDYEWEYLIKTHFEIPWPLWRIGNWKRERTKGEEMNPSLRIDKSALVLSRSLPFVWSGSLHMVNDRPRGLWMRAWLSPCFCSRRSLSILFFLWSQELQIAVGIKTGNFLLWCSLHLILILWAMDIG